MTLVSVVVPTYNSADTLPRAIDSVREQTVDDYEIIIVDDASTDGTENIVDRYEDSRISYLAHPQNKGGSAARNTGIHSAEGEYIAFLDADDEWLPEKLEYQLKTLKNRSEEWVGVHCNRVYDWGWPNKLGYHLARRVGARKPNPPKEGGEKLIKEILMGNLSTGASTLLVKSRTVVSMGGFDPAFPRHQDWEFLIRVLKHGKLAHVDKPLVIKHGTSQPSAEVYEESKDLLLRTFSEEIACLERKGYPITDRQMFFLAKLFLEDGELQDGFSRINFRNLNVSDSLSLLWSVVIGLPNIMNSSSS